MKTTSFLKEFAKYASLNVLGMVGLSCYILADTFFISRGLGAGGLAALNLAIPVYSFIHGSGLMCGMGGATKYSICMGQHDTRSAAAAFTNTLLLTLSLAAVFFTAGILFPGNIAGAFGADGAVFEMTRTYLQVILLFAPVFMMNNLLLCFVRNDGAPHLSMFAMTGGSLSNIVLDYIFIFPCGMGIFGAALATGLAPVISMFILSVFFLRKRNHFHLGKFPVNARLCAQIISGGLPSLITEVSSGVVIIVFNFIILKLEGNIGVAAYGVIANLSLVVMSIYTGIAQGIQPIISRNYGAGQHTGIRAVLRYALTVMAGLSAAVYAFIYWKAPQITRAFNREQNLHFQELAVSGLRIYFTACIFAGFNIILSVYFTSTESARPAHVISLLRGFIISIPMAFMLAHIWGLIGVWRVFPATELIVACIGAALYFKTCYSTVPEDVL